MLDVTVLHAFNDNLIWVVRPTPLSSQSAHQDLNPQNDSLSPTSGSTPENKPINSNSSVVVIDPGDSKVVLEHLNNESLNLVGILLTHHHHDHSGGISQILEKFPNVPIYASQDSPRIEVTHRLSDNEVFEIQELGIEFRALAVPGHTSDHVAFLSDKTLFCGDVVFNNGCGRIFEGNLEQMFDSLHKIMALPEDTLLYCGHEYTLANCKFAKEVMPSNKALQAYTRWAEQQRFEGRCTVPMSLQQHKKTNPFFRTKDPELLAALKNRGLTSTKSELETFGFLRAWKDIYS